MKANELTISDLMIGDWVYFLVDIEGGDTEFDPAVNEYQPMRIESISVSGEVSSELGVINDANQLQPIPLTVEILKKSGFMFLGGNLNPKHEKYVWGNVKVTLLTENNILEIAPELTITIKYVHELQHALRLCGINKEITI